MRTLGLFLSFAWWAFGRAAPPDPEISQGGDQIREGQGLDYWLAASKSWNGALRESAASALGQFGPAAVPALAELLKDKNESVRRVAGWSLGRIGPEAKAAIPALTEMLKDKVESVRSVAASVLGKMGPEVKTAVPAIMELLKDKDGGIRGYAVERWGISVPRQSLPSRHSPSCSWMKGFGDKLPQPWGKSDRKQESRSLPLRSCLKQADKSSSAPPSVGKNRSRGQGRRPGAHGVAQDGFRSMAGRPPSWPWERLVPGRRLPSRCSWNGSKMRNGGLRCDRPPSWPWRRCNRPPCPFSFHCSKTTTWNCGALPPRTCGRPIPTVPKRRRPSQPLRGR